MSVANRLEKRKVVAMLIRNAFPQRGVDPCSGGRSSNDCMTLDSKYASVSSCKEYHDPDIGNAINQWKHFQLDGHPHVELCDLLKLKAGQKGAAAKNIIAEGPVGADGEAETRKRCKITAGGVVTSPVSFAVTVSN